MDNKLAEKLDRLRGWLFQGLIAPGDLNFIINEETGAVTVDLDGTFGEEYLDRILMLLRLMRHPADVPEPIFLDPFFGGVAGAPGEGTEPPKPPKLWSLAVLARSNETNDQTLLATPQWAHTRAEAISGAFNHLADDFHNIEIVATEVPLDAWLEEVDSSDENPFAD